jgi:hypothetical protein
VLKGGDLVIKVEILVDLNGVPVSRTEHTEPTPKAAQEYAAHWTHSMITDGFIPEGAMVTYVLTSRPGPAPLSRTEVVDVVAYQHTYAEASITEA